MTCIRQWRTKINGTSIPWRIFFYRIPLNKRMNNHIPQGWIIPQYRTRENYRNTGRLKKTSIPQYRKLPCPPPLRQLTLWMQPCNLKAHELKLIAQKILLSKYQLVNKPYLSHKGIKDKFEIPEHDHFTTIAWLSAQAYIQNHATFYNTYFSRTFCRRILWIKKDCTQWAHKSQWRKKVCEE